MKKKNKNDYYDYYDHGHDHEHELIETIQAKFQTNRQDMSSLLNIISLK